jgi:hypothetical protein
LKREASPCPHKRSPCICSDLSECREDGDKTAAAHFTAAAGGVYYFRVKNLYQPDKHEHTSAPMIIELKPLDRDEGQLQANTYSISTSQQKK